MQQLSTNLTFCFFHVNTYASLFFLLRKSAAKKAFEWNYKQRQEPDPLTMTTMTNDFYRMVEVSDGVLERKEEVVVTFDKSL